MVEYINYEGRELPVRISYYVLKMFKKEKGVSISDLSQKDTDVEVYESLLYYGLVSGHKADKIPLPKEVCPENMEDILDECFMEFMALMPKFFPDEEGKKKKAPMNRAQKRNLNKELKK